MEFLSLNGTFMPHPLPSSLRDHHVRGSRKIIIIRGSGVVDIGRETAFVRHDSVVHKVKTYIRSSQSKFQYGWGRSWKKDASD